MGKWTNEKHGISMLRPLAHNALDDPKKKSRIWSEKFGSWGFYGDHMTDTDTFIIWCAANPGDRIQLSTLGYEDVDVATIISICKEVQAGESIWKMKLLHSSCQLTDIEIKEKFIFNVGWQMLVKN